MNAFGRAALPCRPLLAETITGAAAAAAAAVTLDRRFQAIQTHRAKLAILRQQLAHIEELGETGE